ARGMSAAELRWLLLPGLDGSGRLFRWFLAHVQDRDPVVVRYPPEPGWQLDTYAACAAEAMSVAPRWLVVAESFSGPVAVRLLRDPRIAGIVLVASFVRCPNPLLRALPLAALAAAKRAVAHRLFLRGLCLGREAPDEQVDELASVVRALPA